MVDESTRSIPFTDKSLRKALEQVYDNIATQREWQHLSLALIE